MDLQLNAQDKRKWERLREVMRRNDRILLVYSEYLNRTPRFLNRETVQELQRELEGLSEENAFLVLFAAACGLDCAENAEDRTLNRIFIQPGVHLSDPMLWKNDDYLRTVRFPDVRAGRWTFGNETYLPFEPFVCGNPIRTAEGYEIPQIACFPTEYRFPAVYENGVEWMAVKPNEIETMKQAIVDAKGDAFTFGLGLGYFTFHAAQKESVTSVTVVERDPDLIGMFREKLLPQFPHREKIRIVQADAFDFAEHTLPGLRADTAFVDLWHDQSDGLPLYLRMRRLEKHLPDVRFSYWIEPLLLSSLRRMVFDRLSEPGGAAIQSFTEIETMLSDDFLRKLSPDVRLIKE